MLLELLGRQVGHDQCDDVADDGSKIAPQQRLAHDEISHSANKGEVPVVPEVNIDCAGALGKQHQQVDT